jgi:hypothetical protein
LNLFMSHHFRNFAILNPANKMDTSLSKAFRHTKIQRAYPIRIKTDEASAIIVPVTSWE